MFAKKISFIGPLNQEKNGIILFAKFEKVLKVNKYKNITNIIFFKIFLFQIWNNTIMMIKKFNAPK
ncbi:hypothetical protein [Candidatus Ruminimicrobium bovinum]|uniref:hypothetical protein n=1 Tax=Candidatus Ruminimicrobium bovinum TaxID=3242779 RepID=UPI0039B929B2